MAITYTNLIYDNVIDSLNQLIADEFSIPVYYDEHRGNHSFLITPLEDIIEEGLHTGSNRIITVSIEYELILGGSYNKMNFKQVSEIGERLKRLLYNNRNYSSSGTVKYFDGVVDSVLYERTDDVIKMTAAFRCMVLEII